MTDVPQRQQGGVSVLVTVWDFKHDPVKCHANEAMGLLGLMCEDCYFGRCDCG